MNCVLNILIRAFFTNFSHRLCAGSVSMYPGWDFSSAVSGFCQLFRYPLGQHAETRERPLVPRAVSIEAPKGGAYRQDGGKTRVQSILIIITVIIMGNVVFFLFRTSVNIFFWSILAKTDQLWKKWGFLTKIIGHSPGLWKNSHFENQQTFNISCRFCTKPNYEKKSNFLPKIMGSGTRRRTPKNVCVGVPSGLCALSQKTRVSPTLCKFYG